MLKLARYHIHPVDPLAVSPTSITIAKGSSGTVTASNGLAPYSAKSNKSGVTTSVNNSTITISVGATTTTESATVKVKDSQDNVVEVAVTVSA